MKDLTFRQKVIQGIHDLFYIWKREFGTTFRDQGVLIFFVLVPLGERWRKPSRKWDMCRKAATR